MVHRFWNMVCDFILSLPGVFIIISNTGTDDICLRGSHGSDVGWAGQCSCQATIAWLTQAPERPRQTGAALM